VPRLRLPGAGGKVPRPCPDTAKQVVWGMAFVSAISLAADKLVAIRIKTI